MGLLVRDAGKPWEMREPPTAQLTASQEVGPQAHSCLNYLSLEEDSESSSHNDWPSMAVLDDPLSREPGTHHACNYDLCPYQ